MQLCSVCGVAIIWMLCLFKSGDYFECERVRACLTAVCAVAMPTLGGWPMLFSCVIWCVVGRGEALMSV